MLNQAYKAYQQSSVQTSPAQLVIMLYDGAIRFTKAGIDGIHSRQYEMANTNLQKAQSVVHELIASLNFDFEISKSLISVYEYMLHQLIEANIRKKTEPAEDVLHHLQELRDAWKQVIKMNSQQTAVKRDQLV